MDKAYRQYTVGIISELELIDVWASYLIREWEAGRISLQRALVFGRLVGVWTKNSTD